MVSFDVNGGLIDQITGHNMLLEIYAHIYASLFLFLVSLLSIGVLFYYFRSSIFKYQALFNGMFYTSLVGLGEALEHVYNDPSVGSMFHYMHLLSAPVALIFYLVSLEEIFNGEAQKRKVNSKISLAVFFLSLLTVAMLSRFSTATWDAKIEIPFVLVTALPTLVLAGILLKRSKIISESTLALISLRMMLIGVSSLTISILAGRYGEFTQNAQVYIAFH